MSFKKVNELRKSGKLDEALQLAKEDLYLEPENIWAKRALAWVIYGYVKTNSRTENFEFILNYLEQLQSLQLPTNDPMVFDSIAFQIGKFIFFNIKDFNKGKPTVNTFNTLNSVEKILGVVMSFHFTKPSEAYSYLFKAFHMAFKNSSFYVEFIDNWGLENFMPQDYKNEILENGQSIISIVEQAYIAYAKKLLEGELIRSGKYFIPKTTINREKIEDFLLKLDIVIKEHPEYQYLPYFKAKLLIALGDEEEVLSNFLPFAKKKRNDFWVWELLADTFHAEDERRMACLCKALSLKTPNDFLINTRQKLAELLIKENKFQEAKTEIEKIISARNDNNWKIPKQLTKWTEQEWYKKSQAEKDNSSFYKQYVRIAEEILFADIPEEIVVVEFVNENKSVLNFIKDKSKHGFFKYVGMVEKPEIGDLISVRFRGEGQDGFYKVLSIRKITDETSCDALKQFSGHLKMRETANFGFVDDVFIEPKLIVKHELNKDDLIKGNAVLSFNKKKNVWGWKAIKIY